MAQSPGATIVIYAFTHPGGVPRSNPSQTNQNIEDPPAEPINTLITKYPGHITFIDFEFKFGAKQHIDVELEKICLARLIQLGMGSKFDQRLVTQPLLDLVQALPVRGSFGTLGRAGFTDIYGWISANSTKISAFNITKAMSLVTGFQLLDAWTDPSDYEMRHRMFVLELGKELLLP
jgi:hypothetical protein